MKITKTLKLVLVLLVFAVVAVVFTACGETQLVTPTNIRYDGATITWNSVDGATGYTIQINDGTEYTVNSASYPYDAAGAVFSVAVKAISTEKKVEASEASTMDFTPLGNVAEVRFDVDGAASWDVVETATAYAIRIDGQEIKNVTATSYTEIPAGTHSFQVRPVVEGNNSYYSSWSKPYSVTLLDTVSKDDITYNNGYITWKYVSGAQYYEVMVNGTVLSEKNVGTSVAYDAKNTDFEVNVKAIGNGTSSFNGALSETKKFIFLDTVTNIIVEDGILKWDAVGGADGYILKLNGIERSERLTTNSYDKLSANMATDIQIRPFSNDTAYFSDWSQPKSVLLLPSPVLQWNQDYELDGEANNNAYWDGVSSAAGYTVRLTKPDGTVVVRDYGSTERSFADDYLAVGTYTIEVKANAPQDSTTVYGSVYSAPITVIRLATPKAASQNFITSDPNSVAKGFTVTFEKVTGAVRYELIKDNASLLLGTTNQFQVLDVVANNVTDEQNYNFAIRAKGSVQRVNSRIIATLDSLTQEALTFQIKVLPTPTNPEMKGFDYTYGTVVGAEGYVIDVGGASYTSGNERCDLSNLEAGNYNVKVCARGNGTNVLASNYTAPTNVHRITPPTNIRISVADASEGVLTFDKVMYATGYYVVFNNDGNAIPVGEMMNINQYITEIPGTDVHMTADANYYNADRTEYYMTSKSSATFRCIRLSAPTFGDVAFTDKQFFWKAPANTNTSIYTPTYIVYDAQGIEEIGEKNGTSMNISHLEGGRTYTFYVKAVGNGSTYINSNKSQPMTIYKLATPEVSRLNGKYVWDPVMNATGYVVYVDGVLKATYKEGDALEYIPDFKEVKEYTVEIQAIGDEGYTTINSDKCTIIQETTQLTTPDFTISYSNADRYTETGKVVVTITNQPLYAKGYSYTVGGTTHTSADTTFEIVPNSVGKIEARVYALGGNFDEEGVYYIASQSVGGSNKYVMLLASPNPDSIRLNKQGFLTWASISGAQGYEIIYTINGVQSEVIFCAEASYKLPAFTGSLTVQVSAKGNGTNVISSAWSEFEWSNATVN